MDSKSSRMNRQTKLNVWALMFLLLGAGLVSNPVIPSWVLTVSLIICGLAALVFAVWAAKVSEDSHPTG